MLCQGFSKENCVGLFHPQGNFCTIFHSSVKFFRGSRKKRIRFEKILPSDKTHFFFYIQALVLFIKCEWKSPAFQHMRDSRKWESNLYLLWFCCRDRKWRQRFFDRCRLSWRLCACCLNLKYVKKKKLIKRWRKNSEYFTCKINIYFGSIYLSAICSFLQV